MILIKLFLLFRSCLLSIPFSRKLEASHPAFSFHLPPPRPVSSRFFYIPPFHGFSLTAQNRAPVLPLCLSFPLWPVMSSHLVSPKSGSHFPNPTRSSSVEHHPGVLRSAGGVVYATWSVFISSHAILQCFLWMFFSHLDNKSLAIPPPPRAGPRVFCFFCS